MVDYKHLQRNGIDVIIKTNSKEISKLRVIESKIDEFKVNLNSTMFKQGSNDTEKLSDTNKINLEDLNPATYFNKKLQSMYDDENFIPTGKDIVKLFASSNM